MRPVTIYGCQLAPLLFNVVLEVLSRSVWQGKEKNIKNWRGRNEMSLFIDDIFVYIEDPKESNANLLQLTKYFNTWLDTNLI